MDVTQKDDYQVKIKGVLESIRPYLQADGGDIKFAGLTDDMKVQVNLKGACRTCMIRVQTLMGVEQALKSAVPEISGVVDL